MGSQDPLPIPHQLRRNVLVMRVLDLEVVEMVQPTAETDFIVGNDIIAEIELTAGSLPDLNIPCVMKYA